MDKALYDQINNLVEKSQKILLLTHAKADPDGLGSALSMYMVLKQLGKDVVVATNDPTGEALEFLPYIDQIQNTAGSLDFVLSLDTASKPVSKIKYHTEGDHLKIVVTPKGKRLTVEDFSFAQVEHKYDLIMVFDTGNLEHLGGIYDDNVEMFFNTPVINVDHHASNTDYGTVNLVNVTSAATTEVVFEYLQDLEKRHNKKFITEDIATLLLAGLITDTGSFQHANTSPQSMETGAKLLDLGARQQEIIKNIYKTKKLSTLKLWGTILSKVQVDPVYRMVWSTISEQDLIDSGASADESEGIIDDLLSNAPGAEMVFLIKWNDPQLTSISMRSTTNACDVGTFCTENGGGGHVRAAGFKIKDGTPFEQTVADVLSKARAYQAKRLNIDPDTAPQMAAKPQPVIEPQAAEKPAGGGTKEETYLNFQAPEQMGTVEQPKPKATEKPTRREQKPADEMAGVPMIDADSEPSPEGDHGPDNVEAPKITEVKPPAVEQPAETTEEAPKKKRRRRRRKRAPRDLVRGPDGRFAPKETVQPQEQPATPTPQPTPAPTPAPAVKPLTPPPVPQTAPQPQAPVIQPPQPTTPPPSAAQPNPAPQQPEKPAPDPFAQNQPPQQPETPPPPIV